MNIFKSSNLNFTTLKKIENFDGQIVFYDFFYVCVKFHGKNSLNVVFLIFLLELHRCNKALQIKIMIVGLLYHSYVH
jgi:hypothetical protein